MNVNEPRLKEFEKLLKILEERADEYERYANEDQDENGEPDRYEMGKSDGYFNAYRVAKKLYREWKESLPWDD